MAGPAGNTRHANTAFMTPALAASQAPGRTTGTPLGSRPFRAIVRGEKDKGILRQTLLIEFLHQYAKGVIELGDVAVVLTDSFIINIRVGLHEFRC